MIEIAHILIYCAIVVLFAVVIIWAIEKILAALGGPPIGEIVRVVVVLIALLLIAAKLLPYAGVSF